MMVIARAQERRILGEGQSNEQFGEFNGWMTQMSSSLLSVMKAETRHEQWKSFNLISKYNASRHSRPDVTNFHL